MRANARSGKRNGPSKSGLPLSLFCQPLPPASFLRAVFVLEPDTGILRFRDRLRDPWWNENFAGTEAGNPCQAGYLTISLGPMVGWHKSQQFSIHRIIWKMVHGTDPVGVVDHINGLRDDNRPCNLRDVPASMNSRNWHGDLWKRTVSQRRQEYLWRELRNLDPHPAVDLLSFAS